MAKKLTKRELVDGIAKAVPNCSKKAIEQLMNAYHQLVLKNAKAGLAIPGMGHFVVANRKARLGRNPRTGETLKIPAAKVVRFKVSKSTQKAMLAAK